MAQTETQTEAPTNVQRCGYVVLLGRPNAGKSTLMNSCLGQKLAGVSRKPQTTRNRILGVVTGDNHQLIFLDTPGIHRNRKSFQIHRLMNQAAWSSVSNADLVCYLVDLTVGISEEDNRYLEKLLEISKVPILICASKSDRLKKPDLRVSVAKVRKWLDDYVNSGTTASKKLLPEIFLVSAKVSESVADFKAACASHLPESPFLFAADDFTDRPERFVISEMIREKLFRNLSEEIPYGTSVVIQELTNRPDGTTLVKADIMVNRNSHKSMIIGHQGASIKRIGQQARQDLERHFQGPVYLDLFVKVAEGWLDNAKLIDEFQQLVSE